MPRKISNQVKSKAVGLYRSGMTLREASEEVGVSYETLRRFVQEAGVTSRPRGRVTPSNVNSGKTRSRRCRMARMLSPA